jgi:Zn-dependent peptidase ImmA (M78 family)/predicted secreted protein
MNYRDAVLEGAKNATRLHEVLGTKETIDQNGGRIDVFDATLHQGSTLLFRNLKKLLGAYLNEDGNPGIIVTTQRPLPIQRFTAGHELGHYYMGHEPSIDGDEILGPLNTLASVEVQANVFSAEFLAPKWLLFYHGRRQGWDARSIVNPVVVYQLSLRLGLSYEATCYSLRTHGIITQGSAQSLRTVEPKEIKRRILPESYEPENWFPDVWLLTERDRGARIEGQPEDLFVLQLQEDSGAGYLWDADTLRGEGFEIIKDERSKLDISDAVGASVLHRITTGAAPRRSGSIKLAHKRPWEAQQPPLEQLTINYDVTGKENGLPRAQRRHLDAA